MTEFNIDYRREYGVHQFETTGGQAVSVVSADNWETFTRQMEETDFSGQDLILTPEMMTSPYDLSVLPERLCEAYGRIVRMQVLSSRFPGTTLLLGSASYTDIPSGVGSVRQRPHNSLVAINDAIRTGAAHKLGFFNRVEALTFEAHGDRAFQLVPGRPGTAAVVCSDLLAVAGVPTPDHYPEVCRPDPEVDTLLVGSCWTVPKYQRTKLGVDFESIIRRNLQRCARRAFDTHPSLNDIIVADRSDPDSGTAGPFNVHFTRVPSSSVVKLAPAPSEAR